MALLLNEIIARGGTTAYEDPFSAEDMDHHYISSPDRHRLHARRGQRRRAEILGFQGLFWPDAAVPLPEGWAYIATFARRRPQRRRHRPGAVRRDKGGGAGRGVRSIDATIRADNAGGLAYYGRMGFTDYDRLRAVPLKDGTPVDRRAEATRPLIQSASRANACQRGRRRSAAARAR